jgi:ribose transport system substrate-binding protein
MKTLRKSHAKSVVTVSAVGVVALLAAACGSSHSTTASKSTVSTTKTSVAKTAVSSKVIEFIPSSTATPYFTVAVYGGVKKEAKKFGYKTVMVGPAVSSHVSTEIDTVRSAIARHVAGIVLVPYSPTALVAPVREAEKAGIPVAVVDSTITPMIATSFAAVNDVKGAEAAAAYAAKFVHGKGEYGIIDYNLSTTSGRDREKGFREEMAKYPGMKYVGTEISNSVIATAVSEATTMLEHHPHINVMFGANDRSAIGVAEAVERLHLANKVCVVGFDADLGEVKLIKSGVIKASVLQSPFLEGETGVEIVHDALAHKSVPKEITLPYHVVTYKDYNTSASIAAIRQYLPTYKG